MAPAPAPTLNLESFKDEISQLESEISNLKIKNSNLDSEVSNLKSKDSKLGTEVLNLKTKDSDLASKISDLKAKDSKLVSEVANLKTKDSQLASDISNLKAKDSNLGSEVSNSKAKAYPCPSGWVYGKGYGCFHAAKEASVMSNAAAKAYCKSLDVSAHLAEIRTKAIQNFVLRLKDIKSHGNWWLGGSDRLKV